MDIILQELKSQYESLKSDKFSFNYLDSNDKVAVIVEPRKLEIFPYIVYNVMYNLGPEWNLHIFAHDAEFIKNCLPLSQFSYKLSIMYNDNLTPDDYNMMFKSVNFWNSIKEENILIFQTDSCIINPIPNIDKYLKYPYIGGIYQCSYPTEKFIPNRQTYYSDMNWCSHPNQVHLCNTPYHHYSICGGFSLRKKSAMIDCINKIDKQQIIEYRKKFAMNVHNYILTTEIGEDIYFQHALEMLNYELPTIDTCMDFCENLSTNYTNTKAFGIHNLNKIDNECEVSINIIKQIFNDLHDKQRHIDHDNENPVMKLSLLHKQLQLDFGSFQEEYPEQLMVARFLKGHEKVLEIGANIGRNSMIIASILNNHNSNKNNLVSMECDINIALQLEHNKNKNNLQFYIENSALSKRPLIQRGWDTFVNLEAKVPAGYTKVKTITYEQLKDKYEIEFDTLVLDCEGAFHYILQDMPEILENINMIIMENDYHEIEHKKYIDGVLENTNFKLLYNEAGGWGCCQSCFFQVWGKNNPNIMKKKTCVITACTGNYNQHIKSIDHLGIDGYIFGDANVTWEGTNWKRIHKSYFEHNDNFVKAKFYKCNWNNIPELSEYEIVIWIDATIEIKSVPELDKNTDIIVYNHSYRKDIHSEICASGDVRYTNYIDGLHFQYNSYPIIKWLAITCFIINRRCTAIEQMNNFWFNENIKYSPQDQVSFPVACEKFNIKIRKLDSLSDSNLFTDHYYKHKHNISYDKYNNI